MPVDKYDKNTPAWIKELVRAVAWSRLEETFISRFRNDTSEDGFDRIYEAVQYLKPNILTRVVLYIAEKCTAEEIRAWIITGEHTRHLRACTPLWFEKTFEEIAARAVGTGKYETPHGSRLNDPSLVADLLAAYEEGTVMPRSVARCAYLGDTALLNKLKAHSAEGNTRKILFEIVSNGRGPQEKGPLALTTLFKSTFDPCTPGTHVGELAYMMGKCGDVDTWKLAKKWGMPRRGKRADAAILVLFEHGHLDVLRYLLAEKRFSVTKDNVLLFFRAAMKHTDNNGLLWLVDHMPAGTTVPREEVTDLLKRGRPEHFRVLLGHAGPAYVKNSETATLLLKAACDSGNIEAVRAAMNFINVHITSLNTSVECSVRDDDTVDAVLSYLKHGGSIKDLYEITNLSGAFRRSELPGVEFENLEMLLVKVHNATTRDVDRRNLYSGVLYTIVHHLPMCDSKKSLDDQGGGPAEPKPKRGKKNDAGGSSVT